MMKRASIALLVALSFFVPVGRTAARGTVPAAGRFPVTVVDDLGNHVRLLSRPRRVVSLDPRDTESLFALGVENRVVGDGTKNYEGWTDLKGKFLNRDFRYPSEWPSPWGRDYPIRARRLPHIEGGCCGTPWDIETVESLRPDLVVSLNSDLPTLQKMRDLGLNLIVLDPANLKGILHDISLLGRATGATRQAAVVVRNISGQVSSVKARVARQRGRPRTYYEIDATNPTQPYIAGQGTFIDQAIRIAGGVNIASGVTSPACPGKDCYPQISLEAILKLDPQVIVLGDAKYGVSVPSVRARAGWDGIAAVRSGRIYPFNDDVISRAGPTIGVGIETMANVLHPPAKKQ